MAVFKRTPVFTGGELNADMSSSSGGGSAKGGTGNPALQGREDVIRVLEIDSEVILLKTMKSTTAPKSATGINSKTVFKEVG